MSMDNYIKNLSWSKPKQVQAKAIKSLLYINDSDLDLLCQPNGKDCWENAAIVLKDIGYPRIKNVLLNLIRWIMDVNWPGAKIVFDLLCAVPKEVLTPALEQCIMKAVETKDTEWLYWIKELINECNIQKSNFANIKNYKAIQ